MLTKKRDTILYWLVTGSFLGLMLMSAFAYLTSSPQMVGAMKHLGYPLYLMKILGTAKLLGILAIGYGKIKLLKEWAYAGFTINLLGATASHLFTGDGAALFVPPLVLLALLLASYFLWRKRLTVSHKAHAHLT